MFDILSSLGRVIILAGHYGSGKTNLAANLALTLSAAGRQTALCDLDIVNPYFRSADFTVLMHSRGVETIIPPYANSNLDIPALGAGLSAVLSQESKTVVVDVGGDDAGAAALGRYAPEILKRPHQMLFVYSFYRPLTREAQGALEILRDIETVSRVSFCGIVNCSNLGADTTPEVVRTSIPECEKLSVLSGLPVLFTAVARETAQDFADESPFYPVDIYVKKPWDDINL